MSIGVAIQAPDTRGFVEQIEFAERLGIPTAWSTIGGAGGADTLTSYAAALGRAERIKVGTAIAQTWPKHPIAIAQQALALEQLAPGRLILGVGPAHEPAMARTYGVVWRRPLLQLREYLTVLRALLHEGKVDFEGEHVTARAEFRDPPPRTPLMASALRPRSFELCGELADGAISWMCPRTYLVEQALPALLEGARKAGRTAPPLVAHVPIVVTADRAAAGTSRESGSVTTRAPRSTSRCSRARASRTPPAATVTRSSTTSWCRAPRTRWRSGSAATSTRAWARCSRIPCSIPPTRGARWSARSPLWRALPEACSSPDTTIDFRRPSLEDELARERGIP